MDECVVVFGFARANRCCCMCICVTTFYENFFFLLFLPVLLSHSELEPSAASVNLSLFLSLSVFTSFASLRSCTANTLEWA